MAMEMYLDCVNVLLFPVGTIVLQGVTSEGNWVMVHGLTLYYFLQLHVSLQVFQSKMFNFFK